MLTVNWIVGDEAWAFRNLSRHLQKAMPEYKHIENAEDGYDFKVVLSTHLFRVSAPDNKTILHLDSIRSII